MECNLAKQHPQPLIVQSTPPAKKVIGSLDDLAESERQRLGEPLGLLWPRAVEKANKLALLWACSENAERPQIEEAAAHWAADLVSYLTRRLVYLASRHLAENREESDTKRVYRIIEDAGSKGLDLHGLASRTQWLERRQRNDKVDKLVESFQVDRREIPTRTKTRTVLVARSCLDLAL